MDGKEIKIIRKRNGYTQGEFAKMLGVSLRTVQFWEKDKYRPNKGLIRMIIDLDGANFEQSIQYLKSEPESEIVNSVLKIIQPQLDEINRKMDAINNVIRLAGLTSLENLLKDKSKNKN